MEPLRLGVLESFYIGGSSRRVVGALGPDTQISGQMYVQHIRPVDVTFDLSVIFVHGGMHTGVTWETTPDGREGWQLLFVSAGFDTYVIDQPWRGRSAPDLTGLNPSVTDRETMRPAFTCGMEMGRTFERGGGRFPLDHLDTYASQLWPDFQVFDALAAGTPGLSDPRTQGPLVDLIDRIGPVVLLTHSQGGHVGWMAALARPSHVAAILSVEPAQTVPGLDDPSFPPIPVCLMWGDNLPDNGFTLTKRDVELARTLAAERPSITLDLLPEHGIRGNGHMLMMEDNSTELAERAMRWLRLSLA